jgi:hypothetical protein
MFRLEEPWKKRVHAQKPRAGESNDVAVRCGKKPALIQRAQRLFESLQDVDAILRREVRRADTAKLQLQDQLADEPLFVVGAAVSLLTGRGLIFSGIRQLTIGLAAALVTYVIGSIIGVSTTG